MEQIQPRFEFRAWSDDFGTIGDNIVTLGQCRTKQPSQEIYIVSSEDIPLIVKIRGECLDIKRLIQVDRGLEQWQPCLKEGFPISLETLKEKVIPILNLEMPKAIAERYTPDDFLETVVQPSDRWVAVSVCKRRLQCWLAGGAAEIVEVEVNGTVTQTIAVESTDPDLVLDLVKRLGLDGYKNLNYPAAIEKILEI